MKHTLFVGLTLFLALLSPSISSLQAQTLLSKVELEFEATEGAKSYQVEVRKADKVVVVKDSNEPAFVLELAPGKYEIRTRVRDSRKVFSEWSGAESISVDAPGLVLKPENSFAKAINPDDPFEALHFHWPEMPMAKAYLVKVKDAKNQIVSEKKYTTNQASLALAPGQYFYNVQVIYDESTVSPPSPFEPSLSVSGSEVPSPKVKWQSEKNGERTAHWSVAEGVTALVRLEYSAFLSEEWSLVQDKFEKPELKTLNLRPPGKYRLVLQASVPGWQSSAPTIEEFEVKPVEPELEY